MVVTGKEMALLLNVSDNKQTVWMISKISSYADTLQITD